LLTKLTDVRRHLSLVALFAFFLLLYFRPPRKKVEVSIRQSVSSRVRSGVRIKTATDNCLTWLFWQQTDWVLPVKACSTTELTKSQMQNVRIAKYGSFPWSCHWTCLGSRCWVDDGVFIIVDHVIIIVQKLERGHCESFFSFYLLLSLTESVLVAFSTTTLCLSGHFLFCLKLQFDQIYEVISFATLGIPWHDWVSRPQSLIIQGNGTGKFQPTQLCYSTWSACYKWLCVICVVCMVCIVHVHCAFLWVMIGRT